MFQTLAHQTKKLLLTALLPGLILTSAATAQTWQVVDFPSLDNLTGVSFLSPDTGYVVSSSGKIARTTDAGKTWGGVQITSASLEDVFFANSTTVYVCGTRGGVFKSEDGGRTWKNRSMNDTSMTLLSIRRLSPQSLLVLGLTRDSARSNIGVAMRSTDDGATWKALPAMGTSYGEMLVTPDKTVCFLSWGALHTSNDFGATWHDLKLPDGKPGRVMDVIGRTAIMAGNFGQIAHSSDGGKTWEQMPLPQEESHFTSAVLINDHEGYIAGFASRVYYTSDGGRKWMREPLPRACNLIAMTKIGDRLWAVGADGIILWKKIK
jgi:photosystem II stability/assembly factor-like uncharacterized protein